MISSDANEERLKTSADVVMNGLLWPRNFHIRDVRTVLKRAPPTIHRPYNILIADVIELINRLRRETEQAMSVINDEDTQ